MQNDNLLDQLKRDGRLDQALAATWRDAAQLLAVLDVIGREGGSALVKIDGERKNGLFYTVVISGGKLSGKFFHKDSADLVSALQQAILFYRNEVWLKKH